MADGKKCVALFSGGLDSQVSVLFMHSLGYEVHPVKFLMTFNTPLLGGNAEYDSLKRAGIELKYIEISKKFVDIVRNPVYGYGKNMNPCIDCKMFLLKQAGEYMREIAAGFVITGEVLGQRPMSQHKKTMELIERKAGLAGYVVRPLSAQLLAPTVPEQNGWIDRSKMLNINGRSRRRQMDIAEKFGITEYPTPAGGCLLTEKGYVLRLKDLFASEQEATPEELHLLKAGRHFRIDPLTKVIVGRMERENPVLSDLAHDDDWIATIADGVEGPTTLLRGRIDDETKRLAGEFTAAFSKYRNQDEVAIDLQAKATSEQERIIVKPADADLIERLAVGRF